MRPLEVLLDIPHHPASHLSADLERIYGGPLSLGDSCVFANFVSSLDGVVALDDVGMRPSDIGLKSEADRFVMGLLRAHAEAIVIGAGTLRAEPTHRWTPERVHPAASDAFASLRSSLGLAPAPELVVLTSTGDIDADAPALADAVVVTTSKGADALRHRVHSETDLIEVSGGDVVDVASALDVVRGRGHRRILSEAGPGLTSQMLAARVVGDLFLTLSPMLAGRPEPGSRPGLAEGTDLVESGLRGDLMSVRQHGSHLFLRYALGGVTGRRSHREAAPAS
ncbi:MAG TPA: dihydrofolate reductase family protein [Actinomycetota bacterium]|nr:dihydrofolate reductase family protein [Actinomycetota bacterium]